MASAEASPIFPVLALYPSTCSFLPANSSCSFTTDSFTPFQFLLTPLFSKPHKLHIITMWVVRPILHKLYCCYFNHYDQFSKFHHVPSPLLTSTTTTDRKLPSFPDTDSYILSVNLVLSAAKLCILKPCPHYRAVPDGHWSLSGFPDKVKVYKPFTFGHNQPGSVCL